MSEPATATPSAPRIVKREHYEGPGTGRAWLHIGDRVVPVAVMLSASEPGQGAAIGDVWLSFRGDAPSERGELRVRLDVGAKRFLLSMLEQAVTIGDFERGT